MPKLPLYVDGVLLAECTEAELRAAVGGHARLMVRLAARRELERRGLGAC